MTPTTPTTRTPPTTSDDVYAGYDIDDAADTVTLAAVAPREDAPAQPVDPWSSAWDDVSHHAAPASPAPTAYAGWTPAGYAADPEPTDHAAAEQAYAAVPDVDPDVDAASHGDTSLAGEPADSVASAPAPVASRRSGSSGSVSTGGTWAQRARRARARRARPSARVRRTS